uniref:Ribonuclease A-domain domain-containing protein n=1 Tax=Anabas testudineus TaxID=64144 RepID=A0A3Q1J8M7_ANATE
MKTVLCSFKIYKKENTEILLKAAFSAALDFYDKHVAPNMGINDCKDKLQRVGGDFNTFILTHRKTVEKLCRNVNGMRKLRDVNIIDCKVNKVGELYGAVVTIKCENGIPVNYCRSGSFSHCCPSTV